MTDEAVDAKTPATPASSKRWRWKRWLLAFVVLMAGLGVGAVVMAFRTPSWYAPMDVTTKDVDVLADRAQFLVVELSNHKRNATVKENTWSISQDEVNSLIAVRVATDPDGKHMFGVSGPMVIFGDDVIIISARAKQAPATDPRGGVLTVAMTVKMVDAPAGAKDGRARLLIAVEGLWLGSLRVPLWVAQDQIDKVFPQLAPVMKQALMDRRDGKTSESDDQLVGDWLDHARRGAPFLPADPKTGRDFGLRNLKVTQGRLEIVMGPEGD